MPEIINVRNVSFSPSTDPIEKLIARQHRRNLDTFLKFEFSPFQHRQGERLVLGAEYREGKKFSVLKQINLNELSWIERLSFNFHGRTSLEKVASFLESEVKHWQPQNSEETIRLEKQFAHFVRLVKGEKNISIKNPFKRTLKVVLRYPLSTVVKEISHDISYDRLATSQKLQAKVEKILAQEVPIIVPVRSKVCADLKAVAIHAAPRDVFQTVSRDPIGNIDPETEAPTKGERRVIFTYQNPDKDVVNYLLWKEGRKEGEVSFKGGFDVTLSEKEKKKLLTYLTADFEKKALEAVKTGVGNAGFTRVVFVKPRPNGSQPPSALSRALNAATAIGKGFYGAGKVAYEAGKVTGNLASRAQRGLMSSRMI